MSRAYEKYLEDTEGNEEIAIKLDFIHECKFHESEYCHSNAYSFINIEKEILKKLTKYNISAEREASVIDYMKSFESLPDKCTRCV